jgi:hypothetical protein
MDGEDGGINAAPPGKTGILPFNDQGAAGVPARLSIPFC